MRQILLLFLLSTSFSFGQSDDFSSFFQPKETDSLYIKALEKYIEQLKETESKTVYVEYEDYLMRIPKTIRGFEIKKLGFANQKEHFRKNKNHLILVKVSPLTIENGLFHITLTPYAAKRKGKKKMELVYSHFHQTYFRFEKERLIVIKTERGGI
ncbi:hypothetical protein M3P19_09445 [Muricauda sp. 2012CJ35-5]|uniref:DUF4440 domain-containing protein n=1 Tax=Flagellimonas spongiicola TaxID=2942208 RepID=A0ABT0PSA4_9FLAO|nr:hypothetical protein [Allomuricauda spongiicola]MCL6274234.1 hypothetical protein [Allomuricauda spongiicola]